MSHSDIPVLMGYFNELGICWEGNTASGRKSRRFLHYSGINLLMQVLAGMTRGGALLINREDLVAASEGGLGCTVAEMIKLKTWR